MDMCVRRRWLARPIAVGAVACSGLLGAWGLAWAAPVPLPDAATVAREVQAVLDELQLDPQGPGLTLLVARGDTVLVETARGLASIELGVPLQPQHRLRIGSVTKQFAAALLLKLIDEGRASLDDPLSKFLPDYPGGAAITLAQILNHTGGMKSYTGIRGYMGNPVRRDLSTAELVAEFKHLPADFAPGTQWRYNNSGYVLVGAVIEAITGQPWHEALAQRVLAPHGVDVVYPAPDRLVARHASGYTSGPQGRRGMPAPAELISMTQPHAAGALVGDVRALWQWNRLLHEGGLLQAATLQRMRTPEGAAQEARYGFGLIAGSVRGEPLWVHGGGIHGFSAQLAYLPQSRVTVALLRNSDRANVAGETLVRRVAAIALGRPYPTPTPVALAREAQQRFEGVYERSGTRITLRMVEGTLTAQRGSGRPLPLMALGPTRFALDGGIAQLAIEIDAGGSPTGLRWHPEGDGEGEAWTRVGEVPALAR